MWLAMRDKQRECESVRDALERSTGESEAYGGLALANLLARLPEGVGRHVNQCSDCRTFANELLDVRGLFRTAESGAQPGPYFLPRVMAAIAEREATLEKSAQIWAAVPRLAYRLSVLASLTLLIAGSWLYEQPKRSAGRSVISAEQNSEGLVDGSASTIPDDFLLNAADR